VAVVVSSPATSEVLPADPWTSRAPVFSNGSVSSTSSATVTPSLVTLGLPQPLSRTALRPRGPSVLRTARVGWPAPARAHEGRARIRRLYDIEAEVRPLDDPGRLTARQARARPALESLFGWLVEQRAHVLPKSPMGVAVGYALGIRAALARYIEAGFLAIDNNTCERALRAVAVGRKNYLFAGRDGGGSSGAVLYSVVGSSSYSSTPSE
jgi:hypothetical protein